MQSKYVVVRTPGFDAVFVGALVAEAAGKKFDVCILSGLAGIDEMELHPTIAGLASHRKPRMNAI